MMMLLCGLKIKVVVDSEATGERECRRFGLEGFEDGRVGFRNRTHLHLPCSCRFDPFFSSFLSFSLCVIFVNNSWAKKGADVVATDRGEAIKLLDHNIAKNTREGEHRIKRADLSWGEDQETQPILAEHKPVDLVVVSECIYNLQYAPHLLKTLLNLCSATTRVLFSFTIRNAVDEQIFFDEKVAEHFVIKQVRGRFSSFILLYCCCDQEE